MSIARFIVVDFSPVPCSPTTMASLTVTSTDLPNVTRLSVLPGAGTIGELDVNLGWFTLAATDYVALAALINGIDGAAIDVTFKLKAGKKTISKVEFASEDEAEGLSRVIGQVAKLEMTLMEDVSKPILMELRELNRTTSQILEILAKQRSKSDYDIKSGT